MNARRLAGLLPLAPLLFFISCDLTEPKDRQFNSAAHPPTVADLQALGILPGTGLAGQMFVSIDPAIGVAQGGALTLLIDNAPANGIWMSDRLVGFDTRSYPDGTYLLTVGVKKPGGGPSETGLLGYLGVPDLLYAAPVVLRQTSPIQMPAQPFVPWDNDFRQRPALDGARRVLYVMERDSVKALSTLTHTLLRSRRLTGASFSTAAALRHFALSADGTRLYVYVVLDLSAKIIALDALTFDSLAAATVTYPVSGLVCGDAGHLFVSSTLPNMPSGAAGVVRSLSTATLTQLSELTLPFAAPLQMIISDDRKSIFLASRGVCRVSVESGTPLLQAQKVTDQVASIGVSTNAQRLFLAFNHDPGYGVSYSAGITISNAATLDSTGFVPLTPFTTNVWDILPSGQDLFAVTTDGVGSSTARVAKYSNLLAMTASWDFISYSLPTPIQVSGDGRSIYAYGGATRIPLP